MKCQVIVADPPWGFSDGLKKMKRKVRRSAASQYKTMTPAQVAALPVPQIVDTAGCVLALLVTGRMLEHGLIVMHAWGFNLKHIFVWFKLKKGYALEKDWNRSTRVGMGRLFRQSHEIALICTHGKGVYKNLKNKGQRSVAFALNLGHSTKPDDLHRRLELMFPTVDRAELFARRVLPGWNCLGDAIDGKDIAIAIQDLATV